ncbi:RecF/RecN/SMC protein [Coccomyxa subellipsoidea C-169]|uniref:Structural maintenance of chromosomes protein n=1 Tax=Coccomyxa subellipsoidea (strain C-169) TaxID=574566 RepID=I0YMD8_COCSC|nr:RecF/RecN/SMC protein [Coccomyxa subellipsoidea C-169]EIE19557.1 RecF/RecN/SMC protein [Coccomyxa subellipsoidea C-169]|eukprot:XP_005644101.1 RecF/RecN/SMC protein [Coccomyxa subellipsoidea C-169]
MEVEGEATGAGPRRLIITEMVLENFKSYAGEQRVGPFHKCFSSVVGPNGSGKSNVIDAMLFVFGKKAKQLRLSKVSELIHNSTNHKHLDSAKVSVYFQEIIDLDDEAFEVVPGTGFVVSRTAMRNNSSNYYVDGRKSSFGEVTDMLKGKGIDLDNNRFLILQGEVEQISMMKPVAQGPHDTGLLEYLEDIIGTDKYKSQLEEGAKRLEELSEARQSVVNRVKAAEKERDGLDGAKAVAEAYLAKERECTATQSTIFQIFVRDGQRNIDKIASNLVELEAKLKHEQDKFQTYGQDLKDAESKFEAEKKEHGKMQKELDAANERFKEYERKDVKLREDIKHLLAKQKKLADKRSKDSAKAQVLTEEAASLEQQAPKLAAKAVELAKQLQKEEEELARMCEGIKGEVEGLRTEASQIRTQQAPWEAQAAEVNGRISVATAERDLLLKKQGDAQKRLKASILSRQGRSAGKLQIKAAKNARTCRRREAEAARKEAAAATAEAERLQGTLRKVRGTVAQRRAERSAQSSQSAVIQALMAARKDIPGIRGRLGELGAIDAKFDVAVSTAAPALDYVVVDDTASAQACVELLRSRKLGVATFLILDKQAHLAAKCAQSVSPPEGVQRLFDLVKCSEAALRPAFFYALGDTVVAADLEQASRIAYGRDKRWARVVTVQGEIINDSGTMTGGGGRARGGRMRLGSGAPRPVETAAAAAELAAAEKQEEASLKALAEARQMAERSGAALSSAEKALSSLETSISKARMEAAAQRAKADDLAARLDSLRAATKVATEDAAAIKRLEAEVKAAQKDLEPISKKLAPLQAKLAALEARMEDAGGPPLTKQRQKVAQLLHDIAAAEEESAKKKVGAAAAAKQLEKLRKEATKTESDAAAELDDQALEVLQAAKATEAILAQKAESLAAIRSEFERKQKEVNIIQVAEVNISNAIKDQSDSAAAEKSMQKQWTRKLAEATKKLAQGEGTFTVGSAGEAPAPLTPEELDALDPKELEYRVTMLEEELGRMAPDLGVIEEWKRKDADYTTRLADLEAATAARNEVREAHETLRKRRLDEFMAGFNAISLKLKEMYQMITLGGDAELELVDSLDPFSEGIVFSVRPPKKSWKNIANLSGGEKTLSSLSLVFALHHYKPTPLYVMDEIDAALDFKNVSIVAHYIKERTKNAQFVIISLRNNMFELADRLVGIYKTDNATKSVTINPGAFAVRPALAPVAAS